MGNLLLLWRKRLIRYNSDMSRESIVLILGLIVLLVPGSGLPEGWILYILRAAGVVLIIVGYLLRRSAYYRKTHIGGGERATDSFVESNPDNRHI